MTYEGQEDASAPGPGLRRRQGRLNRSHGRPSLRDGRPAAPRYRLKRSIQVFRPPQGGLFLVRLGAGDDLEVENPRPVDRCLLEILAGESFLTLAELEGELRQRQLPSELASLAIDELLPLDVLDAVAYPALLDSPVAERYSRQLIYFADLAAPELGPEPLQQRLAQASVVLIGCGGLGSWVASGLACAGVGRLVLLDDDRVALSNLNRQILFSEAQIGQLKVEAARRSLLALNSDLKVDTIAKRVMGLSDLVSVLDPQPDLVIATADWPPHELPRWINSACVAAGVPWLGAGQFPPRLRVGPLVVPGHSACLECLEAAVREEHPLYDQLTEWRARGQTTDASVGCVSGVIGSLLASEAMHFLLGAFRPASVGQALNLDLRTMRLAVEQVERRFDCPACGPRGSARSLEKS